MIDTQVFRKVMGNYPTGVCVVTAAGDDGALYALVVGSFTSVSLDPPLIGFLPAKTSGSWPLIDRVGHFCVNVLGSDQAALCAQMAKPGVDKFEGVAHKPSPNGAPLLEGILAWIDCTLHGVADAGDHLFVMGLVNEMAVASEDDPMLFFRGKYGGFREIMRDDLGRR